MLNTSSLSAVKSAKFSSRFVKPLYGSYCFSNIPSTIKYLLTGKGQNVLPPDILGTLATKYEKILFFFVDAFGWHLFTRYADKYPLLKTFSTQGIVSQITSQFPSTTAAHVTCMHTGLEVGQSGIYEWNYYEPLVDEIISPLLFSYAGDKSTRDSLKRSAIPAAAFFPSQTFYQSLQMEGINSYIFQYQAYTPSTYSDVVFQGARVFPYKYIQEALYHMAQLVAATSHAPCYYFLYFDRVDVASHHHGPYSKRTEETLEGFLQMVEQFLLGNTRGRTGNTLLIMTADHGQTGVDPRQTYYLNKHIPGIERYLQRNQKGNLLVPAGSARDMFLHVKEESLDLVVNLLREKLAGRAEIYPTQQLITQQFFGSHAPSSVFLARLGNVVILPYEGESVWWYEEGKFDMHFKGHHGGLTAEEMEIPLLLLPL